MSQYLPRTTPTWHMPLLAFTVFCMMGVLSNGTDTRASPQADPRMQKPSTNTVTVTATATATASAAQIKIAADIGISESELTALFKKPLYQMKPREVGRYLAYLHEAEPDLRTRVMHLARKNIGQPYEIFLLGEFPFEIHDNNPMFNLERSDCVVFAEHTYAMALSRSWEEFFWMLQRIRYANGVIGVTTRNHYTEADWNVQNAWLVSDISAAVAGDRVARYRAVIDRAAFLKKSHQTNTTIALQIINESYVPTYAVADVLSKLKAGDFVNVISLKSAQGESEFLASHVGLVVIGANGERRFLHSSEPAVREETFSDFIKRAEAREVRNLANGKSSLVLKGFKFLRLNDQPVVPPMAPQPRPQPGLQK